MKHEIPDEVIDRVVAASVPELKKALRAVMERAGSDFFTFADWTLRDAYGAYAGIKTKVVCVMTTESIGEVLLGTALGLEKSQELVAKWNEHAGKRKAS